ncbi:hypothetical protein K504DRAFT_495914 [Pleomassaria siparia CBS 279.74]|uniref:RING-type domain-containing protein n=1 Tax=Pleomassaria siparia CBS 279.74 TaxID=1314801 RepID=A0A6G1JRX6_9PLEO|nr:hypothetical protein K504DRAFT_495914 [Pleomassaria siparia CBS 279.74]
MPETASEDVDFPFPGAEDTPATTEVYRQVRVHLRNLAGIRDLIYHGKDKAEQRPLIPTSTIEEIKSHTILAIKQTGMSRLQIPLTTNSSPTPRPPEELLDSARKARKWLLEMIKYQSFLDRGHFVRLFRSIVVLEPPNWTDLQQMYYVLTNDELGDEENRLRAAFVLCMQGRFASRYKTELKKAKEHVYLNSLQQLLHTDPVMMEAMDNAQDKADGVIIDHFACAIPLYPHITQTSSEEESCSICQNSHVDFATSTVKDLLADYPVRIKYCGHVFGKSCLEQWMTTQVLNPAKINYTQCPMCRRQISDLEPPMLPEDMIDKIQHSKFIEQVRKCTDMDDEQCEDGIKRVMSEEIAVLELRAEFERFKNRDVEGLDEGNLRDVERQLKRAAKRVKKEKQIWHVREDSWITARKEWMESGVTL